MISQSAIIAPLNDSLIELPIRKLHPLAQAPRFAHGPREDAGMDLHAVESAVLEPGGRASVGCGIAIEVPPGYEGQVRPRSGLAVRNGVTLLNAPGTIDPGYRGEVRVILINHGSQTYRVEPGDRVAQLVIGRYAAVEWRWAEDLEESDRSDSGFGSTGA